VKILLANWKDTRHPLAGGAEFYTQQVLEHLALFGHEVTWFAASAPGLPEREVTNSVTIIRGGSRLTVAQAARSYWEREGVLQGFDVIIDEINTKPFHATRWRDAPPVVALIHQVAKEVWFEETPLPVALVGRWLLEPAWMRSYRKVPVVTVSQSSKQSLLDLGLENVTDLGQGGEEQEIRDLTAGLKRELNPTLMFCGRMSGSKRPLHALEAFKTIRDEVPEAKLWMVGEGPELESVRSRASLIGGVEVLGRVPFKERCERMASAWSMIVTSRREGWGLIVSEAAAAGTRSVGYDVPGLRDSIPACGGILTPESAPDMASIVIKEHLNLASMPSPESTGTVSWEDLARRWEGFLLSAAR
jgi:glycosyltransferase involved in cell wall biosynthesis